MKSTGNLFSITGLIILCLCISGMNTHAQTVKDYNGKVYKTFQFGPQEWFAENLNVDHFRNGDPIPQVKTDSAWILAGKAGKPVWCYYANDTANGRKYGKLYNYFALTDPRGLAPKGWHSPTLSDWATLVQNLRGVDVAGIKLKSPTGWKQTPPGSNISGFTALPGGFRTEKGKFQEVDKKGQWWTTQGDVGSGEEIWSMGLNSFTIEVGYYRVNKGTGLSVRCVKD